jgi:unspecific monooxygenase
MPEPPAVDPYLEILAAEDPAPLIHRLRTEDPVHYVPAFGFWFVTRHDDVKRLFHDPENVTPDRRAWERYEPPPEGSMLRWVDDAGPMALAPEAHGRIRRLVAAAFTPRAVRRMEEQIREVVERFAAPLRGRPGEILDLLGELTNPVPNAVISRLTGVPPAGDDEARFRELAQSIIRAFFPFTTPEAVREAEAGFAELAARVREMAIERRRAPREDLVSDLVRARDRDERLSDDEIVLLLTGILGAGSETTALGGLVLIDTLLKHPEQMTRVRDDRSLVPKAVNEVLRFALGGPAGVTRYAVRTFTLRGREIRKGQMLMLSFGGASRDPAVYAEPDVFDLDRGAHDLLVFGNGSHYCLGANLARVELGSMLEAALEIAPAGSRVRDDLRQFQALGLYKRALNFPVEIAGGKR